MKQTQLERYIALFLFAATLIFFSYAEEESKKIKKLYTKTPPNSHARIALKTPAISPAP